MASLLRPVALESCKSSLRSRRRSSASVVQAAAQIVGIRTSTCNTPSGEHVFIDDDDDFKVGHSSSVTSQEFPLDVTCPPRALVTNRPCDLNSPHRSSSSLPNVVTDTTTTPISSSLPSRKNSMTSDVTHEEPTIERLKWRLASGYFAYFMCGWGDGVTGTVLPYFMKEFHISSQMTSLLYAGSTIGFLTGTLLVELINKKLGTFDFSKSTTSWIPQWPILSFLVGQKTDSKTIGYSRYQARLLGLLVSSILHGSFFVIMASRGGFPALFCAYIAAALARSVLTAELNQFFAAGPKSAISVCYAFWSIGGIVSPLVCQAMMAIGIPWFKFYYGSLILSGINVIFLLTTFKTTPKEFSEDRANALAVSIEDSSALSTPVEEKSENWQSSPLTSPNDKSGRPPNALRFSLSLPYQWAVQIFALLYCGCETATQCFMVTYLLETRRADPNTAGYVTAGFWGGITIGRLAWGHFASRTTYTQRKWIVEVCLCIALVLQITIWVVDSSIANAVAASVIGALYGPLFPACLTLANDLLPVEARMVSMALISALASVGAAIFPFVAGTIASAKGIHTLTYVTVPLAASISILWALFPSKITTQKNMV